MQKVQEVSTRESSCPRRSHFQKTTVIQVQLFSFEVHQLKFKLNKTSKLCLQNQQKEIQNQQQGY